MDVVEQDALPAISSVLHTPVCLVLEEVVDTIVAQAAEEPVAPVRTTAEAHLPINVMDHQTAITTDSQDAAILNAVLLELAESTTATSMTPTLNHVVHPKP